MPHPLRIGLIGDYSPEVLAHVAIPQALAFAATDAGVPVEPVWLATGRLEQDGADLLPGCDALWCVPGSPYASMDGALAAIRFAREGGAPFLGTCGGFQHALIEYARDVLGLATADHAESNPDAALPLIGPLACALRGVRGGITFTPGSRVAAIYGSLAAEEEYNCSFGVNPAYAHLLDGADLRITGRDATGEVRVVELTTHPFFLATLYQPERRALTGAAHPLVNALVRAAADRSLALERSGGTESLVS
jgi:CTP synthase (UTP-ammonia lyase)